MAVPRMDHEDFKYPCRMSAGAEPELSRPPGRGQTRGANMRYWYYISTSQRGHHFGVARTPTLWAVWEDVCEWVCTKVLRDRWCHLIAHPAVMAAEKRTERFDEVPVSEDWARRYYAWRGMSAWWVDEDEA